MSDFIDRLSPDQEWDHKNQLDSEAAKIDAARLAEVGGTISAVTIRVLRSGAGLETIGSDFVADVPVGCPARALRPARRARDFVETALDGHLRRWVEGTATAADSRFRDVLRCGLRRTKRHDGIAVASSVHGLNLLPAPV